jgi:phosphate/sulfate permease
MEWDPQLFMVVIGGLISLGLCFSMGANDESMASAYGAKSLSMAKALAIGSAMVNFNCVSYLISASASDWKRDPWF